MREHFVIAGGGQAAAQAANSVRQAGFDGSISMITDEGHLPYQRPPLSKGFLAGEVERDRILLKPQHFYETREIEVVTRRTVVAVDPAESNVRLDDGRELHYSHLLLATGGEPRRLDLPGAGLQGIHYLRSIDDSEAIKDHFSTGARLLIIGAGYIGLEVAAVASRAGLSVTVVETRSHAMSRTVCPEVADFFVDRHRCAGVDLRFEAGVETFLGDSRLKGARTSTGERLECDLALVAVGIEPRTALAEAAGLRVDDGVVVDPQGRTSASRIFAAGDCTRHPHPWAGHPIRLESVQNAIEQGKAVAAAICGSDYAFDALPWFWSDQYDLKLQVAGLSAGYDETVMRGSKDDGTFSIFYLAGGRVIAVDAVNDPRSFIAAKKHLPDKPAWSAEAIQDLDCDLNELGS